MGIYFCLVNGDRNCLKFCKNALDLTQSTLSFCTGNTEITFSTFIPSVIFLPPSFYTHKSFFIQIIAKITLCSNWQYNTYWLVSIINARRFRIFIWYITVIMTFKDKKFYAVFIPTQLYISFRQNIFNIQLNHPSSVLYSLHLIILESPIKRITLQNIKSSLYK